MSQTVRRIWHRCPFSPTICNEYLDEFFIAVRAEYCIEYDHDKTFLDDGNIDQYFYLIKDPETDVWMIVDASTNSQPGSNP